MKKSILRLGLSALLATNFLLFTEPAPSFNGVVFAAEAQKIKGQISNISQKARTIALTKSDASFFLVKFTDKTKLKEVESIKEFTEGEAIIVDYTTVNGENIAISLEKSHVKLPAGIKEIKTRELAEIMASNKDLVVIDARPEVVYEESHIPGAISIPFSKLVKMGDDGAQLLEKYKGRQLVFYCGGST